MRLEKATLEERRRQYMARMFPRDRAHISLTLLLLVVLLIILARTLVALPHAVLGQDGKLESSHLLRAVGSIVLQVLICLCLYRELKRAPGEANPHIFLWRQALIAGAVVLLGIGVCLWLMLPDL